MARLRARGRLAPNENERQLEDVRAEYVRLVESGVFAGSGVHVVRLDASAEQRVVEVRVWEAVRLAVSGSVA